MPFPGLSHFVQKSLGSGSKLRFDPTGAHQAPAAHRLEQGEQAKGNQGGAGPPGEPLASKPRNDAGHAEDGSRYPSLAVYIAFKECRHAKIWDTRNRAQDDEPVKPRRFHSEQWLPRPAEEAFPFFADARNLQALTPGWLGSSVVPPVSTALMALSSKAA
jgi:hypothetical protein